MRVVERRIVGTLLISKDGFILLGFKDKSKGGRYSDCWVLPGGGVKDGETDIEALCREIREEIGLDISEYSSVLVDSSLTGETEKTLPDTGEHVIAHMQFFDYVTHVPADARDIPVRAGDDLAEVKWMTKADLKRSRLSPSAEELLRRQKFL